MTLKNTILAIFIFLFSISLYGQDPLDPGWQWAERGGSSAALSGDQLHDWGMERIVDIAVDGDNNYYYLAELGGYNFTFGNMEFDTYNDAANRRDIFVFSMDDSGNFRWSKVIGGGWDDKGAASLNVDENNNVYVSGSTINIQGNTPVHFDNDTLMEEGSSTPGPNNKRAFLIKYDSEGNFQWLRQPEGDEASFGGSASWTKTVIESNGHTHSLVWFWPGTHLNGQLTVEPDSFKAVIVNYDENGVLLDFIPLNMQPEITSPYNYQMAYDANLDRYYIADTYRGTSGIMGIDEYGDDTNAFYLAAVDNQGEVLWYHQDHFRQFYTTGDLKLDDVGNVYFSGFFRTPTSSASNPNSFAGYEFDAEGGGSGIQDPFLIKLDPDGNLLWGTNAQLYSPFDGQSIVVDGDNVYLGLGMLDNTWGGLEIPAAPNGAGLTPDIQIIRFDAQTGATQEVIQNSEVHTPTQDVIMAMALDNNGDLVVGGYFGSDLFSGTDLHLHNNGQDSDFFIAKYHLPDTVVDGVTDHTLETVKVYPNPTTGILNLQSEAGLVSYSLYDLQGRLIKQGNVETNQIDLSEMESGVYVLRVWDRDGGVGNFRVAKE